MGYSPKGHKESDMTTHTNKPTWFVLLIFNWCKAASWCGGHVKVGLLLP